MHIYREHYEFIVSLLDNPKLDREIIKKQIKDKVLEPWPGKYRIIDMEYMNRWIDEPYIESFIAECGPIIIGDIITITSVERDCDDCCYGYGPNDHLLISDEFWDMVEAVNYE